MLDALKDLAPAPQDDPDEDEDDGNTSERDNSSKHSAPPTPKDDGPPILVPPSVPVPVPSPHSSDGTPSEHGTVDLFRSDTEDEPKDQPDESSEDVVDEMLVVFVRRFL